MTLTNRFKTLILEILKNGILLGFSLVFCLLLGEIGVRILGLVPVTALDSKKISQDGLSFQPGGRWVYSEPEFIEYVSINSLGYRDEEPELGRKSIVFLGDSQTYGTGVQQGERASDHVRSSLSSDCQYAKPPVVNISMPGASTRKELQMLKRSISKGLKVDHVFLMVVSNDHAQNFLEDQQKLAVPSVKNTSFMLELTNYLRKVRYNSRLLVYILQKLSQEKWFQEYYAKSKVLGNWGEILYTDVIYYQNELAETQLNHTKTLIEELNSIVPTTIVIIPDRYEYDPKLRALLEENLIKKGIERDKIELGLERRILSDFASKRGIEVVDPTTLFAEEVSRTDLYYPINGHLNADGQKLLASSMLKQPGFLKRIRDWCFE